MWTIEHEAHSEFNTGVFRAKLATSDFDRSTVNIDNGALVIDTGGPVRAITADADLDLSSSGVLNMQASSIDLISTGAAGIDLGGSSISVGLNTSTTLGFYGATGTSQPTVTGAGDARLTDLLSKLDALGLINDQTT